MRSAFTILALTALAGPLSALPVSAETPCRDTSFSTCAAAQLSVAGRDLDLMVWQPRGVTASRGAAETSLTVRFDMTGSSEMDKGFGSEPGSGSAISANECWSEELTGYRHRVECPVVVTPEPISMTLIATGLAAMGGAGAIRRRKRPIEL